MYNKLSFLGLLKKKKILVKTSVFAFSNITMHQSKGKELTWLMQLKLILYHGRYQVFEYGMQIPCI
jgi:hypothetical protein